MPIPPAPDYMEIRPQPPRRAQWAPGFIPYPPHRCVLEPWKNLAGRLEPVEECSPQPVVILGWTIGIGEGE